MRDTILDMSEHEEKNLLKQADQVLIGAGAGMGVDSGLPDFRGNQGFWRHYPALKGLSFAEMANPAWFEAHPERAWGFYGHRLNLYRETRPHAGFSLLLQWLQAAGKSWFVFTSNVDGQFQQAGYDQGQILEAHGSIHHLQCMEDCGQPIWPAKHTSVEVDENRCLARPPLPACPACGGLARPNILMFNDFDWDARRTEAQERRYAQWLEAGKSPRVGIELGAGTAIPTVRDELESRCDWLIRINPREGETPARGIVLNCGALEGLRRLLA